MMQIRERNGQVQILLWDSPKKRQWVKAELKKCPNCGAVDWKPSKYVGYCDNSCAMKYRKKDVIRRTIARPCVVCKRIYTVDYRFRNFRKTCLRPECQKILKARRARKLLRADNNFGNTKGPKQEAWVFAECVICGDLYLLVRSHLGRETTCSPACSSLRAKRQAIQQWKDGNIRRKEAIAGFGK